MWIDEQTTVGQPALRSGRPGETQGTEGNQGGDGRMTWVLLSNTSTLPHKTWTSGGQWGRPKSKDGHLTAETEQLEQMSRDMQLPY